MLDRNDKTPLHLQIKALIKGQIQSGEIDPAKTVLSERALAERFRVSRMTVRQGLNALREEGLLYPKRGRGTFVSSHKLDIHTRNLTGFSEEMISLGMKPSSRVLQMATLAAETEVSERLRLAKGAQVFRLRRLRLADGIPMSLETSFLPESKFAGLDKFDFEKESLYKVMESRYHTAMSSAEETLEASVSDSEVAGLLDIKKGSALLIVHRTVFGQDNQPIEYTMSVYRADRYRASFFFKKK